MMEHIQLQTKKHCFSKSLNILSLSWLVWHFIFDLNIFILSTPFHKGMVTQIIQQQINDCLNKKYQRPENFATIVILVFKL